MSVAKNTISTVCDGHIRFGVKSNTRYNLDTINSGYTNVGSGIHSLVGGVLSPTFQ